jgi:hypothetical protein
MTSGSAAAGLATLGELPIIGCTSRFFDRHSRGFMISRRLCEMHGSLREMK